MPTPSAPLSSLARFQHYHLVGIGGSGMSAIARVLALRGFTVSGSDRAANPQTDALAALGVRVHVGHDPAHIAGAGALIATSAATEHNPEIAAAGAAGVPVFRRNAMVGALMAAAPGEPAKTAVAVAGTHGKTTTTSMIAHILHETGRQPSYIIGGVLATTGLNADWNPHGRAFVIEADEYDHMFLGLAPDVAVLNNAEWDHPDFFADEAALLDAFARFAARIRPGGVLIVGEDSAGARRAGDAFAGRRVGFGTGAAAEYRAGQVAVGPDGTRFTLHVPGSAPVEVTIQPPGAHNALNALAAMLAAYHAEGVSPTESARALATFAGAARRFEVRGERAGVRVIDDYAHHPTAIAATAAAAQARFPDRTLWVVWQPHTFSRTAALWAEYRAVLAALTAQGVRVLVTDIYAARETATDPAITAARLAAEAEATYTGGLGETAAYLRAHVRGPAAVVIMSAGDAPAIGRALLAGDQGAEHAGDAHDAAAHDGR
jgi:UDP-N-acetylmuramate--alanine ligase